MAPFTDEEVNKPEVLTALRKIEDRTGHLTPDSVFDAAKSNASPLHKFFEWDKTKGWREWNIHIARRLINSVVYVRHVDDHGTAKPVRLPAYVRDPSAEPAQQGYVALRKIVSRTPDARAIVLAECESAASNLRRAAVIGAALGYSKELERMVENVLAFADKVRSAEPEAEAAE